MKLVLQDLDRFIQWGDAFLQFLEGATNILGALILRESMTGPAFLVVGLERNPFLPQPLFGEPLHFGHFIDTSFELDVEFVVCLLCAFGVAHHLFQSLDLCIHRLSLYFV